MTKAAPVEVTIYEKKNCGHCVAMRNAFEDWAEDYRGDVTATTLNAVEHIEKLANLDPPAMQAPVYEIWRDGQLSYVSGYNPDALLDYLEGDDGIWGDEENDGCPVG